MSQRRTRLEWLRRRSPLLFGAFLAVNGALVAVACSSSSNNGFTDEPDATADSSPHDAGLDTNTTGSDTGPQTGGNCAPDGSPVTGNCDPVLQNCPSGQECVVDGTTAKCVGVTASESLPVGRACCPNNATGNPCQPGLTCVGSACADGGPATGRCSPACCDDKICGKSDPEGIAGSCDIVIVDDNNAPLFNACTYRERCQLFGVEPCMNGKGCEVDDNQGTSTCIENSGKTDHQSCSFKNDCADGYICVGGGATGVCRYMCLIPGTTSPFDAGLVDAGAGKGGCPAPQACKISFTPDTAPSWLGACEYPDGG